MNDLVSLDPPPVPVYRLEWTVLALFALNFAVIGLALWAVFR